MCRLTTNIPNSFCEYYYRQMPPATSLPIHCACFVLVLLADTSNHRPRTGREALIFCWSLLVTVGWTDLHESRNEAHIRECEFPVQRIDNRPVGKTRETSIESAIKDFLIFPGSVL